MPTSLHPFQINNPTHYNKINCFCVVIPFAQRKFDIKKRNSQLIYTQSLRINNHNGTKITVLPAMNNRPTVSANLANCPISRNFLIMKHS